MSSRFLVRDVGCPVGVNQAPREALTPAHTCRGWALGCGCERVTLVSCVSCATRALRCLCVSTGGGELGGMTRAECEPRQWVVGWGEGLGSLHLVTSSWPQLTSLGEPGG